jgi:hypothetical protein
MWQIKLGAALGTVALTGLLGVGYYVVAAEKISQNNIK